MRTIALLALAACDSSPASDPDASPPGDGTALRPIGITGGDGVAATTCGDLAMLATVADGSLAIVPLAAPQDGGGPGEPLVLGDGWGDHTAILPSGNGTIYTLDGNALRWSRYRDGEWADGAGRTIAGGWSERVRVVAGGDGVFYSVDQTGQLIWDRHVDPFAGSPDAWRSDGGAVIGDGWGDYLAIVPGGDGVLYAIDRDGALHWFRHLDPFGGDARWADDSGAIVGADWNRAAAVMSAGGGVLYARMPDGVLLWFRHLDPVGGTASWQQVDGLELGATAATLGDPTACYLGAGPTIEAAPQLAYGLHPRASDALRAIGIDADRITQTIGNAPASAGTHAQDGTADGLAYSAATDLSVRGWSENEIRDVLEQLGQVGFAAWYRKPGSDGWPSTEVPHIHAVYAGCAMKLALRDQVRDWLQGKNGLVSHTAYGFYGWTEFAENRVRKLFLAENAGLD